MCENERCKLLWDVTIQCDQATEARRPDIVFLDMETREVKIVDIAITGDTQMKKKPVGKYQLLKDEIGRISNMRKVCVVPVVVGNGFQCF